MNVLRPTLILLTLTACRIGGVGGFLPAKSPVGVTGKIYSESGTIPVELLAVRDTAFVVGNRTQLQTGASCPILLVPFSSIRRAEFRQMGFNATREELRLVSRFPQDITDDLLENLLTVCEQSQIQIVGAQASGGTD